MSEISLIGVCLALANGGGEMLYCTPIDRYSGADTTLSTNHHTSVAFRRRAFTGAILALTELAKSTP